MCSSRSIVVLAAACALAAPRLASGSNAAVPVLGEVRRASRPQLDGAKLETSRLRSLRGGKSKEEAFEYKEAVKWTIITMTSAVAFGIGIIPFKGKNAAMDFFTGFLIEKILSVDNLFVFVMLFDFFKTPEQYQRKVLSIGIFSAIILRGIMIAVGVQLVQRFRPILLVFAGILVLSSLKMTKEALHMEDDDEEDIGENKVVQLANKMVSASDRYDGSKFFTVRNGKRCATPMLTVLICIELSDIVFAVDSIPAIVGITKDTFIVYTSNIFAILGLRNLYVLLAKAVQDLIYLKASVAVILGFVGLKMVLEFVHVHITSTQSLLTVAALLGIGVYASLRDKALKEARKAQRRSLF